MSRYLAPRCQLPFYHLCTYIASLVIVLHRPTRYFLVSTSILLSQPCAQKSAPKIGPISTLTFTIRLQSSRIFFAPTYCQSATFGPLAFCVCPFFLRQQIKKNFASPQLRFLDAIFMRQFSGRCRHCRLLITAHDFARLRPTTHN